SSVAGIKAFCATSSLRPASRLTCGVHALEYQVWLNWELTKQDLKEDLEMRSIVVVVLAVAPLGHGSGLGADTRITPNPEQLVRNLGGSIPRDKKLPNAKIVGINLDQTEVTDKDLKQLSNLRHLKMLALNGTAVSDAGMKDVAKLPTLVHLEVMVTKVTCT